MQGIAVKEQKKKKLKKPHKEVSIETTVDCTDPMVSGRWRLKTKRTPDLE